MSNFSNRIKNLEKIISEFQKEDNVNNLTKQTLFDHLGNVAMSSNNNTQSARVNAGCNTIEENQLGKQHITKLFKNLQEAEGVELDIDSAAKEVAEILRNYRCTKFPAPLHTSGNGNRIENLDGDGDDSEEGDDCDDDDDELDKDYQVNHCYDYDDEFDYDTKHSIAQIGKANNSSNYGNNNRMNNTIHLQKKRPFESSEVKSNDEVVLCNQMVLNRNQIKIPCLDQCCKEKAKIPTTTKKKRNDEMLKSYVYEQTIMELEVRDISM